MFTRSLFWIALLSLVALAAFTLACGGSSNSTTTKACTGSYTVVGDWQGTASSNGQSDSLVGVINTSGEAMFFDNAADIISLPSLTGACSFSETLTAYSSIANGSGSTTSTATGNFTSDTALNGSDESNGTTTQFNFTSSPFVSTISALSGTVGGVAEGQLSDSFIFDLGGTSSSITFSGTDATNCTITGTATQEGTNNVYDVTFDVAGTGCSAANLVGLGFESSTDQFGVDGNAAGTYLYVVITNYTAPFVVEIRPAGGDARDLHHHTAHTNGFRTMFGIRPRA